MQLLQPIGHDGRDGVFRGQIRKGDASSLLLTGVLAHGGLTTLGPLCCEEDEPQKATCVGALVGNAHL